MNFCPSCGTQRRGQFCANCGFRFPDTSASNTQSNNAAEVAVVVNLVEESKTTDEVEATSPAIADGLTYGVDFNGKIHCANCGNKLSRSKCASCASDGK